MSRLVLSALNAPPPPPQEGQVALVFAEGTLYAWVGGQSPAPIVTGDPAAQSSYAWTAQFSGELTSGPTGLDEVLFPPYVISLAPEQLQVQAAPAALAGPGPVTPTTTTIVSYAVHVLSNTLDAKAVVGVSFLSGAGAEVEVPAGTADTYTVADDFTCGALGSGDVIDVFVGSKDSTTGSIKLAVTVTLKTAPTAVTPV